MQLRAEIVLLPPDGTATREIGRILGCTPGTASTWRVRYAPDRPAGLDEAGSRGAAAKFGPADRKRISAMLDRPPPMGNHRSSRQSMLLPPTGTGAPRDPIPSAPLGNNTLDCQRSQANSLIFRLPRHDKCRTRGSRITARVTGLAQPSKILSSHPRTDPISARRRPVASFA